MGKEGPLKAYIDKRNFTRTAEPPGGRIHQSTEPIFVIQKHAARHLHYDFRLEVGGVLKSWAVPKGPSTDPKVKRLAVPTEDHPLEYAEFEGVIPEGEYGGGTVMVWDLGTYRNLSMKGGQEISPGQALEKGHISVWLAGKKLRGGYSLTRFKKGPEESWLLVKMADEEADAGSDILLTQPDSALTGRTLGEITASR
jgi:DNA ligase D-like protein (predicted 3'-phosphoesterase)